MECEDVLFRLSRKWTFGPFVLMDKGAFWREVTGLEIVNNETLIGHFDKRIKNLYGGIL